MSASVPSKTQVRNAGRRVRDVYSGPTSLGSMMPAESERLLEDFEAIEWYRQSFAGPLLKVRMGLKLFLRTNGYPEAQLAQRHKRLARIMAKLHRYPSMNLTTMQDIGGCRVIVPDLKAVEKIRDHLDKRWSAYITKEYDYITNPRDSGYRAIHVIVNRDDRMVEIQLRTERQHRWADAVESLSRSIGSELKWGEDPRGVGQLLGVYADGLADLDQGRPMPDVVRDAIQQIFGPTDNV